MALALKKCRVSTEVSRSNKIYTLTLITEGRMFKMPWQRVIKEGAKQGGITLQQESRKHSEENTRDGHVGVNFPGAWCKPGHKCRKA